MNPSSSRLLLVEDNPGDARLIQEVLKDAPGPAFELVHAGLLKDALQRISEEPFAAILLDMYLPDSQGLETVKCIVAAAPHMPILVLTGMMDGQVALNALNVGAQDYIIKGSLDGAGMERAIRYAIQRKQFLERLRILRDVDQAIGSTLHLNEIFSAFLESIEALFPIEASCVQCLDKSSGQLETLEVRRVDADDLTHYQIDPTPLLARAAKPSGLPFALKTLGIDNDLDPFGLFVRKGWTSVLQVPLIVNEMPWGLISLFMSSKGGLSEEIIDILKMITSRLAVAVQNAQLYESIVNLAEDLGRANKIKDEFLSIMSHELRTPLNVMMNCAEILRDGIVGEVTPEQRSILNRLLVQSRNQLSLINGILHVTRMESDKVEASYQEVDLSELMEDLRADYAISFAKEGVALRLSIPSDLAVVKTDRDKVRQILENLTNNAIKFTAAGEIRISARMIDKTPEEVAPSAQQRWFEFEVTDTGTGIPQESLAAIFDKFQQLDTTATRAHGGVGIGLYLVKKFADLLGGQVSVRSQLGRGSGFTVTIPCAEEAPCTSKGLFASDKPLTDSLN